MKAKNCYLSHFKPTFGFYTTWKTFQGIHMGHLLEMGWNLHFIKYVKGIAASYLFFPIQYRFFTLRDTIYDQFLPVELQFSWM